MILLDVQHLSKTFPVEGGILRQVVGKVQALKDVSFRVDSESVVGLVGGSGSGKSTIAKIIAGLLEPDSGNLLWENRPLGAYSRLERAQNIQMIFQDPYASLNPKLSIETQLEEVLRSSFRRKPESSAKPLDPGFRRGDVINKCVSLLESVGLSADALTHYPFQFSGGQRQRVAIARALAMRPKLLIADEPLSALDVTTQAQILELFVQLRKTLQLTFLFITHDLVVARHFADQVVVLQDGSVVEDGPAAEVLGHPHHAYTRALLDAVPRIPC